MFRPRTQGVRGSSKNKRHLLLAALLFLAPASLRGDTQRVRIREPLRPLPDTVTKYLDEQTASIVGPPDAQEIIRATLATAVPSATAKVPDLLATAFYCVIHVVRWADAVEGKEPVVQAQNWYVYYNDTKNLSSWSNEDFTTRQRLFGAKTFWLLYIHLNKPEDLRYQPRYDIEVKAKLPQNLQNIFAILALIPVEEQKLPQRAKPIPRSFWGGSEVRVAYRPSDITITPQIVKLVDEQPSGSPILLGNATTFDNEGRHFWDVSVGVPIRRLSELSIDTTANTVTAREIDKQNIFGLLNLYPVPVDLKGTKFTWIPHFVGGVAIARQPLRKILIGAGWGPSFVQFYAGAVWVKQDELSTLQPGSSATPQELSADLRRKYNAQFAFGINLPIRGIREALASSKK